MDLYVVEKKLGGILLLDVRGRITLGSETEVLRGKISDVVRSGQLQIVLDLGEVSYIDSAGLSTLVAAYTTVRKQGGNLKLLHLTRRVRDLLQITRLSTVFELYNSLQDALASFARESPPVPPPAAC